MKGLTSSMAAKICSLVPRDYLTQNKFEKHAYAQPFLANAHILLSLFAYYELCLISLDPTYSNTHLQGSAK